MPEPISACTVPISYYEEPEESAPLPQTPRQAACQAAYAECMDAAEYEAAGQALACGAAGLLAAGGPAGVVAAVAAFALCEAKTLLDVEADEAMCRSNYYRCDPGQ